MKRIFLTATLLVAPSFAAATGIGTALAPLTADELTPAITAAAQAECGSATWLALAEFDAAGHANSHTITIACLDD